MTKLVESVPNFSEGRDLSLVSDIVAAVKAAKVLDVHSDPDHNRSVVTFLGEPQAVKQAVYELTERAMQLLDVKGHLGVHPFIGVVDVVPFIPVKNISVSETVKLAHEFGQSVAAELALPVFFYGEAAKDAKHRELPHVRRQSYVAQNKPDLGTGLHLTAGAVAVGVRDFLIAFNVNLDTNDVDIARSIAENIREKSGGLPGIRALGLELESKGCTQVSINIVDHRTTSLKQVFDEVSKWAKEYDVRINASELVGMIPEEVVFDGMKDYLKLPGFSKKQVLFS